MKRVLFAGSMLCIALCAYTQTAIPDGYEGLAWGTQLGAAKSGIKGKIVYTDEKKVIITRDGALEYNYGFFYTDPAFLSSAAPEGETPAATTTQPGATQPAATEPAATRPVQPTGADEGKLFYVALHFPYLSFEDVMKKYKEKYGEPTAENLTNNQGACAWDSKNTIIIMWIDRYEKRPYCRRVTYVSKEIAKELPAYHEKIFNSVEMDVIRKLTP